MDKPVLVETDLEVGGVLLNKLDKIDFQVKAALWFYFSDSNEWRLVFASPAVDKKGPKEAYREVQAQLEDLEKRYQLSLQNIALLSPDDNLVKLLKAAIKTGPGVAPIRFAGNTINNVFIEDAYIYRLA